MRFQFLKGLKKTRLVSDSSGQATVEYILILSVTVVLALIVMRQFVGPVFKKASARLNASIDNALFGANMHYYRLPR